MSNGTPIKHLKSDLTKHIGEGVGKTSLLKIMNSLFGEVYKNIEDVDFRYALTKESIPIMLLAIADYSNEYFKHT